MLLRRLYSKYGRKNKLRKIIKFLINDNRIQIKYKNINLFAGLNSSIEHAVFFDEYNEGFIFRNYFIFRF